MIKGPTGKDLYPVVVIVERANGQDAYPFVVEAVSQDEATGLGLRIGHKVAPGQHVRAKAGLSQIITYEEAVVIDTNKTSCR